MFVSEGVWFIGAIFSTFYRFAAILSACLHRSRLLTGSDASPQNDISAPTKWGSLIFQRAFGGVISDGDCGPVVGSDYAIFLKFNSELGVSLVDSGRSWKQHHFFLYIIVVLKKVRQTSLKQFKHFCSVLFWYKEAADWMVINFIPFHFHSMENSKPVRFPPPW